MNVNDMTDDDLNDLRIEVQGEQGRRASRASIPSQIAELADAYEASGGDRSDLTQALEGGDEE